MTPSPDLILAMDFGTSNSLIGFADKDKEVLALPIDRFSRDQTVMRSLVYFADENTAFYGAEAIREYILHDFEGRLFRSFKTHLPNASYLGTTVGKNRRLPLEELVGLFLLQLKKKAELAADSSIESVVLGRPARYSMDPVEDELAVHRMRKAAEFAGFKDVRFIPEPLAAAFNYRKNLTREKIVLIGDFGGGTSDFTIIKMGPSAFKKEDVLAIEGIPFAGDALDSLFMSQQLNKNFGALAKYRIPMSNNWLSMPPSILDRLNKPAHVVHLKEHATYEFIREIKKVVVNQKDKNDIERLLTMVDDNQIFSFFEEIEKSKRDLSNHDDTLFDFNYPGLEINETLRRNDFEHWSSEFKVKVFGALDKALSDASLSAASIDLICLTGGTSLVPFVREEFERRFGKDKMDTSAYFHSVQGGLVEAAKLLVSGVDIGSR